MSRIDARADHVVALDHHEVAETQLRFRSMIITLRVNYGDLRKDASRGNAIFPGFAMS
jgi:hypothetical protein